MDQKRIKQTELARSAALQANAARYKEGEKPALVPLRMRVLDRARRNPKSKALGWRAYWLWFDGFHKRPMSREDRQEYAQRVAEARGRHAVAIRNRCLWCVGCPVADGQEQLDYSTLNTPDGSARIAVRDCQVTDCPLFPVRPWQTYLANSDQEVTKAPLKQT